MNIISFIPKTFASNCYVLHTDGVGVVIDPSIPYNDFLSRGGKSGAIQIKYIIITHSHFDHFLCIEDWIKNTNATVLVGVDDGPALSDPYLNCYKLFMNSCLSYNGEYKALQDGENIMVGEETITVISTPGHTKGAIAIITDDSAFVGDTVFAQGGIGRTDLPGGNYSMLMASIEKIRLLPKGMVIYPGHGEFTYSEKI